MSHGCLTAAAGGPAGSVLCAVRMQFQLLGRSELAGPSARTPVSGRVAVLLAALVLDRPRPWSRAELFELLWPTGQPNDVDHALRVLTSRLRGTLTAAGADESVVVAGEGVVALDLEIPRAAVDVEDALDALQAAERAQAAQRWADAALAADTACDALHQEFLPRHDGLWVRMWRERLGAAHVRALLVAATAAHALGDHVAAVDFAERALLVDPFDEGSVRVAMRAHAAQGRRGAALAVYERCRALLDRELGVRPAGETEALRTMLAGAAPAARVSDAVADGGLRVFAASSPFVGRAGELGRLTDAWQAAQAGGLRLAVITGEAGIGKTRLGAELAARAATTGAATGWGRCFADGSDAYLPLSHVAAQLAERDPESLGALGPLASNLGPLVPEYVSARATTDDHARDRMFYAAAAFFRHAARKPTLLVLDDLQWASPDGLSLVEHVLPALLDRACMIVVTARELDGHAAEFVANLVRAHDTTTIALDGLTVADVHALIAANGVDTAGGDRAVVDALLQRTDGNALYLTQYIRDAQTSGRPLDPDVVPAALADLLLGRIAALPRETRQLVELAAVFGGEFDLGALEACSAQAADDVLERVEDLCARRFLDERGPERFAFAHDLLRETILGAMGSTRRTRTHRRVASSLAESGGAPAEIATHYAESGPGRRADAAHWHRRAGELALAHAAWAEAARHFEASRALATTGDGRGRALVGLGRAQRALGDSAGARASLEEARSMARDGGLADVLAAATLALVGGGGRGVALDLDDASRAALLREARDALAEEHPNLLVPVLGELALALVLTDNVAERVAICDDCIEAAERWGDPAGLAFALLTRRIARMGPAHTRDRLADAERILAMPAATIPTEHVIAANLAVVEDQLELGDRAAARRALATAQEHAERFRHPYWSWATACWGVLDTIIDGDLDDVEALAFAACAHQDAQRHPEAAAALGVQLVDLRLFQGRAAEVVEMLRTAADTTPNVPTYRAVLTLVCAETGDHDGARAELAFFADRDFELPPDSNWLLGTAVLADAAATVGDDAAMRALAPRLEPFADRHVVLNCYGGGGAYWGPVAHHLARLAAARGDDALAAQYRARAGAASAEYGGAAYAPRLGTMESGGPLGIPDRRGRI